MRSANSHELVLAAAVIAHQDNVLEAVDHHAIDDLLIDAGEDAAIDVTESGVSGFK